MKKRNTILIPGILSIIILTSVQVFLAGSIWKQKNEMFDLDYTMRSQEAITFINRRLPTDGFDTVRFILSKQSELFNQEMSRISDTAGINSKK